MMGVAWVSRCALVGRVGAGMSWVAGVSMRLGLPSCSVRAIASGRAWGSWRVAGLLPVAAGTSVLEVGVLGATPQLLWFSAWGFSIRCCGPRWGGAVKDTGARCAAVHGVAGPDTNEGLDSDSSESVMALTHVTFRSVSGSVSSCL